MIDFTQYRSILCLDGTLPDADFFQRNLPIIAADGAANTLMKMGIKPQLVVGDLDSLDPALITQLETFYHEDQNYCDFEKSLAYLEKENLLPCIVVGMNGGFLDHILNNINIFMKSDNVLYAPPLYGYVVKQNRSFNLPLNTKISLLGIPFAEISTQGLKWESNQAKLAFPGANSCFNRTISENIQITVHDGSVLMLIYKP
jgi:thiamine pyrophosphokinase